MFHRAVPLLRSAAARSYATATAKPKQDLAPILIGAGLFGSCLFWYSTQGSAKALAESKAPRPAALRNDQFTNFKSVSGSDEHRADSSRLETILPYNHNTSRFVFALPEGTTSGLVTASALLVKSATEGEALGANGKAVVRPYTPTTGPNVEGKLELMIKHYPTGVMSSHIFGLKAGDELAFKGPIAKFAYKANEFESITLIAGGSGVTPMWQVMQEIDANPLDKTKVTLLYANVTEADILLRKEFEGEQIFPAFLVRTH